MAYIQYNGFYIAEDGNYGGGNILVADQDAFTEEQMERLGELNDNDRYPYAVAVLNGQDASEWED